MVRIRILHILLLQQKEQWIKDKDLWGEVREIYQEKKNKNINLDKKSRTMYYETINEIYDNF